MVLISIGESPLPWERFDVRHTCQTKPNRDLCVFAPARTRSRSLSEETTPVRRWSLSAHPSSPPILNGDDEQSRVWPETVRLVVFTLRLAQGLQVRRRFFKTFSADTTPKGEQRTDEQLLRLPHFRVAHPNDPRYVRLCTFPVHSTVSPRQFSRAQLPRSNFRFVFY